MVSFFLGVSAPLEVHQWPLRFTLRMWMCARSCQLLRNRSSSAPFCFRALSPPHFGGESGRKTWTVKVLSVLLAVGFPEKLTCGTQPSEAWPRSSLKAQEARELGGACLPFWSHQTSRDYDHTYSQADQRKREKALFSGLRGLCSGLIGGDAFSRIILAF